MAQMTTKEIPTSSLAVATELQDVIQPANGSSSRQRAEEDEDRETNGKDIRNDLPPPSTAVEALQRWNNPRINVRGIFATFVGFFIMGMSDASLGVSPF